MRKLSYVFLLIGLYCLNSFAATHYAASCSYDDVSSKVSSASSGDTVIIPAGDCTGANKWASTLSFGTKQIFIMGNGIDSTVIEGTTTTIDMGTAGSQVSHMTINEAKISARNGSAWMIHHVKFRSETLKDLVFVWPTSATHSTGVIHSCQFYNSGIWIAGVYGSSSQIGTVWADVPAPGATDEMVYVEGNTFYRDYVSSGAINIIDGVYGARVVFRFNSIETSSSITSTNAAMYCEAHGCEGAGRAFQYYEYYNNNNINNGGAQVWAYSLRGGTGILYNNTHYGNWGNTGVWVDNYRASITPATGGLCNGSAHQWDGNEAITNGTGTHTGGNSTTVLEDSTKSWTTNALVGMTITNEADGGLTGYHAGSYCIITSNTSTTATCAGLASGEFNSGDTYKISAGYPCRDNIGRGYDSSAWDYNSPSAYTQVLMPMYAWSNTWNGTESNIRVKAAGILNAGQVQANRDFYNYTASFNGTSGVGKGLVAARPASCTTGVAYWATNESKLYKCTSTNTWSEYFTPATCPHPLADPLTQGSCNYGATGADGYTLTGSTVTLTINKTGSGCVITSTPSGVSCGSTCSASYESGTSVQLGGYLYNGWASITYGGDCSSDGTVTMSGNKTCTVTCTADQILALIR